MAPFLVQPIPRNVRPCMARVACRGDLAAYPRPDAGADFRCLYLLPKGPQFLGGNAGGQVVQPAQRRADLPAARNRFDVLPLRVQPGSKGLLFPVGLLSNMFAVRVRVNCNLSSR